MSPVAETDGRQPRLTQIDGVRAIAVAAVIWSHWLPKEYQPAFSIGQAGVTLFFVISGYLITNILMAHRAFPAPHVIASFLMRRALRIFPIYWLTILLCVLLGGEAFGELRSSWLWHAGYLSNIRQFMDQAWTPGAAHFWSLSVEEQFLSRLAINRSYWGTPEIVPSNNSDACRRNTLSSCLHGSSSGDQTGWGAAIHRL